MTIVEPESGSLELFLRDLEPFSPPDPFHTLVVHRPACSMQHRRDAAIAISAVLNCEFDDVCGEGRFIVGACLDLALCRAVLAENPAGESLGHAVLGHHMVDASTTASRA
jgi:hypothetical protein